MERIVLIVPSCVGRGEEACAAIVSLGMSLEPVIVPNLMCAWFLLRGCREHFDPDTGLWRVACRSSQIVATIVDDNARVELHETLPATPPDGRQVNVYWAHPVTYDATWCGRLFLRCRQTPQQFAALPVLQQMGALVEANPLPSNWHDIGPSLPDAALYLRDRIVPQAA